MHYHYKENIINLRNRRSWKSRLLFLHGLGCDLNMMKACLEPI